MTITMQQRILNYRVIIEPYRQKGKRTVYLAECPTLGVFDWGNSVETVLKSVREGITIHIHNLVKANEEIPIDNIEEEMLTTTQVRIPLHGVRFSSA